MNLLDKGDDLCCSDCTMSDPSKMHYFSRIQHTSFDIFEEYDQHSDAACMDSQELNRVAYDSKIEEL